MSSVCRVCLTGNTRLYSLENSLLIDVYEKLSTTKFYAEDARPRVLCCFCYQKLLKCHTFFQMADRSEKIFTHLYYLGHKATHEYISEVDLGMKPPLTVAVTQIIIIDGNTTDAGSQEISKQPIPNVDINEEATTEQDELVEVESVLEDCTNSQIKSEENNSDQGNDVEELSYGIHDEETKPDDSKMTLRCNNCKSGIKQYTNMKQGKIIYNQKKIFVCHVCLSDKELVRKDNLISHTRTHTGDKPFACSVCNKKFSRKHLFVSHMRAHTKEKKFTCNICDKKCNNNQSLVIHMRNHTGEKPFVCNVCDKQFKQKAHLISHMRIHTGEKPFACKVCDKQFSHKKSLDLHMKSHTGAQPIVCDVCERQYKQKSDLIRHMRNHTGVMPFACNVCNKPFNLNRDLVRHMRKHTGETPFSCNECDKKFSLKCNLAKHVRIHT